MKIGSRRRRTSPEIRAISPRLLLELWLVATSEGVGSARALERLCNSHDVERWLCGRVSLRYHALAAVRVGCPDLLDRLLAEHLAALANAKLIDFDTLSQDGVRIRASAGASSFRRGATLDRHLATAQAVVDELKREVDVRSDASDRAHQGRHASGRRASAAERVKAAQTDAPPRSSSSAKSAIKKRSNGKTSEGAARLHLRRPGACHEDGRWRLPPGLQCAGGRAWQTSRS